ncbi:MAG: hypothetical protein KJ062_14565 [Thermoanaerobaculia bacterium]|nr:hypothetical protein [Thermoanaerobaculia bacterium]
MNHGPHTAPESVEKIGRIGLVAGVVGLVLLGAGFATERDQFFRSYLTGYMWMLGLSAGALGVLLLHHVTRGAWGVMIRRILEAAGSPLTLGFAAVAFLPIVLGSHSLYEWTHAEVVAVDAILAHKKPWLNMPAFLLRSAIYLALWLFFATVLSRLSARQDETGDRRLSLWMQRWAAFGLLAYILSMTFAAFDWLMTLTPHWFSTIYGLYVIIGQAVAAMALVALMALALGEGGSPAVPFQPRHLHDYGKLLFAFVCVWAYFGYSQFIIIWSGNLPEETAFYTSRLNGAWKVTTVVLVLLHYALPFALLLSRDRKRSARALAPVAVLLLLARWLDLHWLVAPAFSKDAFTLHWLDFAAPLALGGIWLFLFTLRLKARPLLPAHEPFLKEALAHD